MPSMDPAVSRAVREAKPFKPYYLGPTIRQSAVLAVFIPAALALLPVWILRGLIPFLRPHPEWSLLQTVGVLLVRRHAALHVLFGAQPAAPREGGWRDQTGRLSLFLNLLNNSGPGGSVNLKLSPALTAAGKQRGRLDISWFNPPPLEYFRGVLSIKADPHQQARVSDSESYNGKPILDVKWAKTRTRGIWFMAKEGELPPSHDSSSSSSEKPRDVILYFHGGAGVFYSAADPFMGGTLAKNLAIQTGVDVFSVDYNLAPDAPFPATLVQALGAWLYLTRDLGYKPTQILIGGDSFGSHLALQLERYLSLELPKVEGLSGEPAKPKGYLLLSPWLDLTDDHFPSWNSNRGTDILTTSFPSFGIKSLGFELNGISLKDPYASGLRRSKEDFARLPPTLVINGALETLLDEGKALVKGAKAAGAPIEHIIVPLQPHDFFVLPTSLPTTRRVFKRAGEWIGGL